MIQRWLSPALLAALLAACVEPPSSFNPPPGSVAPSVRGYLGEAELGDHRRASVDHAVLLELESADAAAGAGTLHPGRPDHVVNAIPYQVAEAGSHRVCLDDGDPLLAAVRLEDRAGKALVELERGDGCAEVSLAEGDHTLTVLHDGGKVSARRTIAFVHRTDKVGLLKHPASRAVGNGFGLAASDGAPVPLPDQSDGSWWTFAGGDALGGSDGNQVVHVQYNGDGRYNTACDHYDPKEVINYIVQAVAVRSDSWEYFQPREHALGWTFVAHVNQSLKWDLAPGWQGCRGENADGYATVSCADTLTDGQVYDYPCFDSGYLNLQNDVAYRHSTIGVHGGLFGHHYADDGIGGPVKREMITDLGDYRFRFGHTIDSGWRIDRDAQGNSKPGYVTSYMCAAPGSKYLHGVSDPLWTHSPGDLPERGALYLTRDCHRDFTVRYRYFEDGKDVGQLQRGEVALYGEKNYGGPAIVLIKSADLSKVTVHWDNAVSSIRFGAMVGLTAYDGSGRSGDHVDYRGEDLPDLGDWDNRITEIRVNRTKDLLISTRACVHCNLAGADLSSLDLSKVKLSGSHLRGVDLRDTDLSGASLDLVDLSHAVLDRTNLAGANLAWADLSFSSLVRTNLVKANLSATKLRHTNLASADGRSSAYFSDELTIFRDLVERTDFTGATISTQSFALSNWRFLDLSQAKLVQQLPIGKTTWPLDLSRTDLRGARLAGVDLTGANLDDVQLGVDRDKHTVSCPHVTTYLVAYGIAAFGTRCKSYDWHGALCGEGKDDDCPKSHEVGGDVASDLSDARLTGASLRGASLEGANVRRARFNNADLTGADLTNLVADVVDTDCDSGIPTQLDGAFLIDAKLDGARLNCATLTEASVYSFVGQASVVGANLFGAHLSGAILAGLDLSQTTLQKVDLTLANLVDADLTGADLTGALMRGTFLQGAKLNKAKLVDARLSNARLSFEAGSVTVDCIDPQGEQLSVPYAYGVSSRDDVSTSDGTTCPDGDAGPCGDLEPRWTAPVPKTPECIPSAGHRCPRPQD